MVNELYEWLRSILLGTYLANKFLQNFYPCKYDVLQTHALVRFQNQLVCKNCGEKWQYRIVVDLIIIRFGVLQENDMSERINAAANVPSSEKPKLKGLIRDDPKTKEGKYLVKRRDGTVVEWPSFVLGARDPHAEVALRAYADSIEKDLDADPAYAVRLRQVADEWAEYRAKHGAGDPTRGVHRIDDPATIEEMRKGYSA